MYVIRPILVLNYLSYWPPKRKTYVVFVSHVSGVYDTWEEARAQ